MVWFAKVKTAYSGSSSQDLSLHVNEIISVSQRGDDGWWVGEIRGVSGRFPADNVREIKAGMRSDINSIFNEIEQQQRLFCG
jgi:hypothetical protein